MYDRNFTIIRILIETVEEILKYTSDLETDNDFENDSETFDASVMNFIVFRRKHIKTVC